MENAIKRIQRQKERLRLLEVETELFATYVRARLNEIQIELCYVQRCGVLQNEEEVNALKTLVEKIDEVKKSLMPK